MLKWTLVAVRKKCMRLLVDALWTPLYPFVLGGSKRHKLCDVTVPSFKKVTLLMVAIKPFIRSLMQFVTLAAMCE